MQHPRWVVTPLVLGGTLALASARNLPSQVMTMPKNMSHLTGDAGEGSSWNENRFRLLVIYDADEFPWGKGVGFSIRGFRVRRTSLVNGKFDNMKRKPTITMSLDGTAPSVLNSSTYGTPFKFADTHGRLIEARSVQDVDFPCQGQVASRVATDFVADFAFPSNPYFVDPSTQNLVIELDVTRPSNSPRWDVDHEDARGLDRGSLLRMGSRCPQTGAPACLTSRSPMAMANVGMSGMYFDPNPRHMFELWVLPDVPTPTSSSAGGGWLGPVRSSPLQAPNGCLFAVDPVFVFSQVFGATANKILLTGRVPNDPTLVGGVFGCQFAALDSGWSGGFGLSAGYQVTIGSGVASDSRFAALYYSSGSGYSYCSSTSSRGCVLSSVPVIEFY